MTHLKMDSLNCSQMISRWDIFIENRPKYYYQLIEGRSSGRLEPQQFYLKFAFGQGFDDDWVVGHVPP